MIRVLTHPPTTLDKHKSYRGLSKASSGGWRGGDRWARAHRLPRKHDAAWSLDWRKLSVVWLKKVIGWLKKAGSARTEAVCRLERDEGCCGRVWSPEPLPLRQGGQGLGVRWSSHSRAQICGSSPMNPWRPETIVGAGHSSTAGPCLWPWRRRRRRWHGPRRWNIGFQNG